MCVSFLVKSEEFVISILILLFVSVACQNFGFNTNQNQQQQSGFNQFVINGRAPSPQRQQRFFDTRVPSSVQIFHQFQVNPSSTPRFHEEEPFQQPQQLGRASNELQPPPPQQNFQQREGRNRDVSNDDNKRIMSDTCLACLCQASTQCNLTTRCISNNEYCGAFLISKPYWTDAQRPTLMGDNPERPDGKGNSIENLAFVDCALDPVCSAQTVRNYMSRFEQDCNGDGAIDCDDLARIHLMSAFDCNNPKVPTTGFYQKFHSCWDRVLQLSTKK